MVKCPLVLLLDTPLINILMLDQHPDQYSVDTRSALDQLQVSGWLNVCQLICINQKLVNSGMTVN